MATAILIKEDGTLEDIKLPAEDNLSTMYEALECQRVEKVSLTDRLDMWLDEDGLGVKPVNALATLFAFQFGHTYQAYCGAALIAGMSPLGSSVNLGDAQARLIKANLVDLAATLK